MSIEIILPEPVQMKLGENPRALPVQTPAATGFLHHSASFIFEIPQRLTDWYSEPSMRSGRENAAFCSPMQSEKTHSPV